MEKILKRIDELISICSVADKDTFNEIKYEIDQLIIDILGKNSESYRNFVSIYNSSLFSWEKCRRSIGILNAIKNYINQSMQNKKYNVFVSSTFIDLKSYRKALADEIVFLGHFAAGMEDFTACGEDLETYIKKVIDEADYYVLMIGQRFGSPIPRNKSVSYTMMEYDYAKSRGMRIIPLIYSGQQTLEGNDLDVNGDKFNRFVESIKRLCHNKQLINSHFYRGVSELPYKLLFAVIYTHLEFRYEVSHTITSHHVHHFHQTRIPDGTLLDYMVQYRKPLFPQFFLYPKKFLPENNPHHKEFHLRPYIQNNANQ